MNRNESEKQNDNGIEESEMLDDTCDIYVSKLCDNCGECIGLGSSDYKVVRIEGILDGEKALQEIDIDEYILEDITLDKLDDSSESDIDLSSDGGSLIVEYIEDIPMLKEEYEKKIDHLLGRE